MKSVIVDDITFDQGPWLHMSPEGLDLLQVCLCRSSSVDHITPAASYILPFWSVL